MKDEEYIGSVKMVLSSRKSVADKIAEIAALELPYNASPLTVLVHGDSQHLKSAVSYAENDDPSHPSEEEVRGLTEDVSTEIISKLKKYLSDWDSGNTYRYMFELKASYGAFKNEHGDVEYVDVVRRYPDAKTVSEAIKAAQDWQSLLSERVKLYQNQEVGHKLISVRPTYAIRDTNLEKIAAGTLQGDDESGVSTWLNQS